MVRKCSDNSFVLFIALRLSFYFCQYLFGHGYQPIRLQILEKDQKYYFEKFEVTEQDAIDIISMDLFPDLIPHCMYSVTNSPFKLLSK